MHVSVLSETCSCLSFCVCDQLSDVATRVRRRAVRVCTRVWLFKKKRKKKRKVDDSCVRWRLYQSLLNPEVPLAVFWQADFISGLFMLLSLQPGVSQCACACLFGKYISREA